MAAEPISLAALLQRRDVWRGRDPSRPHGEAVEASGHSALDQAIGGWPRGALTELLPVRPGIGELGLLLPSLARLSQAGHWLAWIAPPHLPYAPALAAAGLDLQRLLWVRPPPEQAPWAMEQALRSGACAAVLGWPQEGSPHWGPRTLRRLQLAAEAGRACGLLWRSPGAAALTSPAALRLRLDLGRDGDLEIEILKRRGGGQGQRLAQPRPDPALPRAMADPAGTRRHPAPARALIGL